MRWWNCGGLRERRAPQGLDWIGSSATQSWKEIASLINSKEAAKGKAALWRMCLCVCVCVCIYPKINLIKSSHLKTFPSLLMHAEHRMTKKKAKHVREDFFIFVLSTRQTDAHTDTTTSPTAEIFRCSTQWLSRNLLKLSKEINLEFSNEVFSIVLETMLHNVGVEVSRENRICRAEKIINYVALNVIPLEKWSNYMEAGRQSCTRINIITCMMERGVESWVESNIRRYKSSSRACHITTRRQWKSISQSMRLECEERLSN